MYWFLIGLLVGVVLTSCVVCMLFFLWRIETIDKEQSMPSASSD